MSSNLPQQLKQSLIAFMYMYHDSQSKIRKNKKCKLKNYNSAKTEDYLNEAAKKNDNVQETIDNIINNIKTIEYGIDERNKEESSFHRQDFLIYIRNYILYFQNELQENDTLATLSKEQLQEKEKHLKTLEKNISTFLWDLRSLLHTYKNKEHYALGNDNQLKVINGLKSNASSFFGTVLCNSGNIILKCLFEKLELNYESSKEDINKVSKTLCSQYKDTLKNILEKKANSTDENEQFKIKYMQLKEKYQNSETKRLNVEKQLKKVTEENKRLKEKIGKKPEPKPSLDHSMWKNKPKKQRKEEIKKKNKKSEIQLSID